MKKREKKEIIFVACLKIQFEWLTISVENHMKMYIHECHVCSTYKIY
jgi:hypothetical protein